MKVLVNMCLVCEYLVSVCEYVVSIYKYTVSECVCVSVITIIA